MKLIRVKAEGFRKYRDLDIDLGGCRLIRIYGNNGTGKSTIVESLAWSIFGRLRAGSIKSASHRGFSFARSSRASSREAYPHVQWTVKVKDKCIQIGRWKGGSEVKISQGGSKEDRIVKSGSKAVTEFPVERLGIKYDDLRATAWCLQGDVMRPLSMAKQDRIDLIRRLLLEERESRAAVNDRAPELFEVPLEELECGTGMSDGDAELSDTERKARGQVKNARDQLADAREKLEAATSALKEAEKQESEYRKLFDESRDRLTASLKRRSQLIVLKAAIQGLKQEKDGLKRQLADCANDLKWLRQIENRANRFDPSKLDRAIAQLDEDLTKFHRLETAVQEARERRLIRNNVAKARGDWHDSVSDALESSITKGECLTCGRRVWTKHLTLKLKLNHAKERARQARLEDARTSTPRAEEIELSDHIRRLETGIYTLQGRVKVLQFEHGYTEAVKSLFHRIPSLVAKHTELEDRLSEVIRCIKVHRQELDANRCHDQELDCLDDAVNEARQRWQNSSKEVQGRREDRNRLERKYWKLAQTAVDAAARATGVDEDDVRSCLETAMDGILKALAVNSQLPLAISVDRHFKPTLHERDRKGPVISSGGLDVIVALAMRLALVKLMKERHPKQHSICNLLIFDESFANVDSQWLTRFRELLTDELLRDKELHVLEIGSASPEGQMEELTVCTVHVADGNATVDE